MGTKKQTVRKLVKKNKTRNNQMNGGWLGVSLSRDDQNVLANIEELENMKYENGKVVFIHSIGLYDDDKLPFELEKYKQTMEDYFVFCTNMMSKFYNFFKEKKHFDTENEFTNNLKKILRDKIKYKKILYFPFENGSKVIMDYILEKPKNCLLLSKYIRHMKKICMGFDFKLFKYNYDYTKYPEWDLLPWPKMELRLNNILDAQFCMDIKNKRFTLTEIDLYQKHTKFPPFFNSNNNPDSKSFTSFKLIGFHHNYEPFNYHNDLLDFLKQTYGNNTNVPVYESDQTYIITDKISDEISDETTYNPLLNITFANTNETSNNPILHKDETPGGKRRKTSGKNTRLNKKQK